MVDNNNTTVTIAYNDGTSKQFDSGADYSLKYSKYGF